MTGNLPINSFLHRDRAICSDLLGAVEPIPDVLLPAFDLPSQRSLPTSEVHRFLKCNESIHDALCTTLGVICLHPMVFDAQQLSCYPRVMAKKAEKTMAWPNWQDTNTFPERVVWARKRFAEEPSQAAIAGLAGIKQQSMAKAESPKAKGSSYTAQIAAALGVNAHWLATGLGEPFLTLKDLPQGAIDITIALLALHPSRRDAYTKEILGEALAFLPPIHPRFKGIEAMFTDLSAAKRKAREIVVLTTEPTAAAKGKGKTK